MSLTFMICVTDFRDLCPRQSQQTVADLVADFPRALQLTKFHYSDTDEFVTDLSQTLLQTSRHVEMVCVCDFHDLCLQLSPKLHDFMICHHLCPRLS